MKFQVEACLFVFCGSETISFCLNKTVSKSNFLSLSMAPWNGKLLKWSGCWYDNEWEVISHWSRYWAQRKFEKVMWIPFKRLKVEIFFCYWRLVCHPWSTHTPWFQYCRVKMVHLRMKFCLLAHVSVQKRAWIWNPFGLSWDIHVFCFWRNISGL